MKILYFLFIFNAVSTAVAADLLDVYRLAVQNNAELRQVDLRQSFAGEIKAQRLGQMLPAISAQASSTRDRSNNKKANFRSDSAANFASADTQNFYSHRLSVNLRQPVFNWQHWLQLDQADQQIAKAQVQYQAAQQNLLVQVTAAYFAVLEAQDQLRFIRSELAAIARQLQQAQQRFAVGLVATTAVHDAQAKHDLAIANQIVGKNNLQDAQELLQELLGSPVADLLPLQATIPQVAPSPNNIGAWERMAASNNLAIIDAQYRLEIAKYDVAIARSQHLPTLDIIASYGVQDVNSSYGRRGDDLRGGLQIQVPIFAGGVVYAQENQARYQRNIAEENLTAMQRSAKRQVRNSFRAVLANLGKIRALKTAIASYVSSVAASEAGFEVGASTMVDVLVQQSNLYRAKRDYAASRYAYLLSTVKLKQATGNLGEEDLQQINQYIAK